WRCASVRHPQCGTPSSRRILIESVFQSWRSYSSITLVIRADRAILGQSNLCRRPHSCCSVPRCHLTHTSESQRERLRVDWLPRPPEGSIWATRGHFSLLGLPHDEVAHESSYELRI